MTRYCSTGYVIIVYTNSGYSPRFVRFQTYAQAYRVKGLNMAKGFRVRGPFPAKGQD